MAKQTALRFPTVEHALRIAGGSIHAPAEHIAKVAQRMFEHGECAWHANAVVGGFLDRCCCAPCEAERKAGLAPSPPLG